MKQPSMFRVVFLISLFSFINQFTFSQAGTHLNFDGVNDVVNCGNNPVVQITGTKITLEATVRFKAFGANIWDGNIINKEGSSTGYMLRTGSAGYVDFVLGNGSWVTLTSPANTVSLNTWYHLAATYDGTDQKIYVNGVLVASRNVPGISISNNASNLLIGDWAFGGRTINGDIDEVRIWNIARTASEIEGSRYCELQGTEPGLIAYYKFNQGVSGGSNAAVNTLINGTPNAALNGTLTNFGLTGAASNWLAGSPVITGSTIPSMPFVLSGIDFAGANNSVTGTYNLNLTTGFTVEYWFKVNKLDPTKQYGTFSKGAGNLPGPLDAYMNGSAYFGYLLGNGSGYTGYNGNFIPAVATWYHVAHTYNPANGLSCLYVNGVLTQSATYPVASMANTSNPFYLGNRFDGYTDADIKMDKLRIWSVPKTQAEIVANMNTELAGNEAGLDIYYRMNEGTGTTLTDAAAGNGLQNGTFNGVVAWAPAYTYCQNATAVPLQAAGTNLKWYTVESGGTGSSTAPTPSTSTPGTISYWVASSNVNGCESQRVKIDVLVNSTPAAPVVTNQTFCGNATVADLVPSGANFRWFNTLTGGTQLASNTPLVNATKYYVSQTNSSGCESGTRTPDSVTINPLPVAPTVNTPVSYCLNSTASPLTASGTNLKWYTAATGGTGTSVAPTPTTSATGTTSYWVSQTIGATSCEGPRAKIDVVIDTAGGSTMALSGIDLGQTGNSVSCIYDLDEINGFTIEYWFKMNAFPSAGNAASLFSKSLGYGLPEPVYFYVDQSGGLGYSFGSSIYGMNTDYPGVFNIAANTWYHIALKYDPVAEVQSLFVNNSLIASAYYPAGFIISTGDPFYLGNTNDGATDANIKMDELRIWNLPRTDAQIIGNMYKTLNGTEPGLKVYFKMNEQTGNSLTDLATADGAQDGSFNGAVNWMNVYCENEPAAALEVSPSASVKWFTAATGGTGSSTPPAVSSATPGTNSYWVAQSNGCGPDGPRTQINIVTNAATLAGTSISQILPVSGTTSFNTSCNNLIAKVTPNGATPVSGNTTAKVWIDPTQNNTYVKRHYEITPAAGAAAATGWITLYFTQQNFNDFNAVNTGKLPTGPADAAGIANLMIEKRGGTSNDGSGSPGSYTGSIVNINPVDADIVWNAIANRWEVSFAVSGFSGFFVRTVSAVLPVNWLAVSGKVNTQKQAEINWQVQETDVKDYTIEKSNDGRSFSATGNIISRGNGLNQYQFTEPGALQGVAYYRLKQTDNNGRYSYSSIIKLSSQLGAGISVFPNPASDQLVITVGTALLQTTASLLDSKGRLLQSIRLNGQSTTANISQLPAGIYLLNFVNGITEKILKQ